MTNKMDMNMWEEEDNTMEMITSHAPITRPGVNGSHKIWIIVENVQNTKCARIRSAEYSQESD